jgi:hypothetical protein
MKLKLISDGTPYGTSVVNAETGERIDNLQKVTFEIGVGDTLGRLTLEAITEDIDLVSDVTDETGFGDLAGLL